MWAPLITEKSLLGGKWSPLMGTKNLLLEGQVRYEQYIGYIIILSVGSLRFNVSAQFRCTLIGNRLDIKSSN